MAEHAPRIDKDLWKSGVADAEELHEVMCESCRQCGLDNKVMRADLESFVVRALEAHRVPRKEAQIVARNLVSADMRGIASHGVARLGRYLNGIRDGYIVPNIRFDVHDGGVAIAAIDARNGLGQVVSEQAMDLAIQKAAACGVGIVTVRNSNHYGIAGYYVLKALEKRLIGVSMTNAAPLVIPTFGVDAILGTNPIAFGMPSADGQDFLLDMATSVVPRGKLEVHDRNEQEMPVGWAADETGADCRDPGRVLGNLLARAGGGILPLGGRGEEFSGHKGFGLAMMVDMLCGVLSGSAYGREVHHLKREVAPGQIAAPRVGHFFMAIDPARFMSSQELQQRVRDFSAMLRESPTAEGEERIYIHGDKERIKGRMHDLTGVPIAENVLAALRAIAADCGVDPPRTLAMARETATGAAGGPASDAGRGPFRGGARQ